MPARKLDRLERIGERRDLEAGVQPSHDLAQNDPPRRLVVDNQYLEGRDLGFNRIVNQRKRPRCRLHWLFPWPE